MEFKDVFGFEVAPGQEEVRRVQQMIVDARLTLMANQAATAHRTVAELSRLLSSKGIADSASVLCFASGMKMVEEESTSAETTFKTAVQLAKETGFAAMGEVDDFEASRIFGLKSFHRSLNPIETQRVRAVMEALAAAFVVAAENLETAKSRIPAVPQGPDVVAYQEQERSVLSCKQRFWEAHALAKRLGFPIKERHEEHLPSNWRDIYRPYESHREFVANAKKGGLIS